MAFKVKIQLNIANEMHPHAHGEHPKIGVCLHESVSPNYPGMIDIIGVAGYLAHGEDGYGIHGVSDNDGNKAWTLGRGEDIYWHCSGGHTNTNFLGIEQISRVPVDYKTRAAQIKAWLHMQKELNATAQLIAAAARAWEFPIVDNPGNTDLPGVTTHWEVTNYFGVSGGHVDAWPVNRGGYYPKAQVITLARRYYKLGYHF